MDEDSIGKIVYSLGPIQPYFAINPDSGLVYSLVVLDRESEAVHNLTVSANDGIHTAQAALSIRVADTNDNHPVFERCVSSFHGDSNQ